MDAIDRIKEFMKTTGLAENKFGESAGLASSYINKLKTSIGSAKLEQIQMAYPNLNMNWVISGKGSMLLSDSDNIVENKSNLDKQNQKEQRLLSHKDIEQLLTKQKDEIMSELTDVVKDLTNVMLGQTGVMKDQIKLNDSSIVASFDFMKEQLATLQKAIDKVDNKADKVQDSVFKIERKIG